MQKTHVAPHRKQGVLMMPAAQSLANLPQATPKIHPLLRSHAPSVSRCQRIVLVKGAAQSNAVDDGHQEEEQKGGRRQAAAGGVWGTHR